MVLPNFKAYPSNLLTEVWMRFPHFPHHSRLPLPLPQEGCQTSRGTPASWVSCSVNRTEPPVGRLRRVKGCRLTQQLNNSVIDSTTSSPSQQQCHRLNNIVSEPTTTSNQLNQQGIETWLPKGAVKGEAEPVQSCGDRVKGGFSAGALHPYVG